MVVSDIAAGRIALALRLLDHQIVGVDGDLLGNVDDLALHERGDRLVVTALLTGPPALAGRQGGRGGAWLHAIWRRLSAQEDPRTTAVPLTEVTRIDSAVHLTVTASAVLASDQGLELWLRDHVISRLPGARGTSQVPHHDPPARRLDGGAVALKSSEHTLAHLLGAQVRTHDGRALGELLEVTADAVGRTSGHLGPLEVRELVCSPRHLGQHLGYTLSPQGPAVLRHLLRWWHTSDVRIDVRDVASIDWGDATISLRAAAALRHPHDHADDSGGSDAAAPGRPQ